MIDWTQTFTAKSRAEANRRAFEAQIKAHRDAAIRAGISVAGIAVATDDVSQNRLAAAALSALIDPATKVQWKLPSGEFTTLEAPAIIEVAKAVRAHVQACFDHEARLLAQVHAGQVVVIEHGWPESR